MAMNHQYDLSLYSYGMLNNVPVDKFDPVFINEHHPQHFVDYHIIIVALANFGSSHFLMHTTFIAGNHMDFQVVILVEVEQGLLQNQSG